MIRGENVFVTLMIMGENMCRVEIMGNNLCAV